MRYLCMIVLFVVLLTGILMSEPVEKPAIDMVLVEGGSFMMGSDKGREDERPVHEVKLFSFLMSRYEVTQGMFQDIMGFNPSMNKGRDLPVESVTWLEAVTFCNKLSEKEGLTPAYSIKGDDVDCIWGNNGYRLPTEAEWEYAARGGAKSGRFKYAGSDDPGEVAWYSVNSGDKTHEPGGKKANELGLYDMSGNVSELCWDYYYDFYYGMSSDRSPTGLLMGKEHVVRGGSWSEGLDDIKVHARYYMTKINKSLNCGFRVVKDEQ